MEKQADMMHPAGYLAMSGGITDLRLSFSPCHIQSVIPDENKSQPLLTRNSTVMVWLGLVFNFGVQLRK